MIRFDSRRIRSSSLLKWLNSLYRPAWPEESGRELVPPHSRPSIGASPSGKAVDFDSTMRRFESSRPSQPVRRLETLPSVTSEMPANGGLLRIGYRSPGSQIGRCGSEIADSLRRIFEIFPFLGDSDRRPSSIGTAWRSRRLKIGLGSFRRTTGERGYWALVHYTCVAKKIARKSGTPPHTRGGGAAFQELYL
jgi:hypothetical protein